MYSDFGSSCSIFMVLACESMSNGDLANSAIEDTDQRRRESVIDAWAAKGLIVVALIATL